ncbi:uncharacterized protein LOC112903901 [Agrilus planipennis]|uniref:Uncharacterized protein LOC108744983 n=1 Tax=Agrilus planipennis TaxID=224129 RepID=A0A7F5RNZ0_AGRPL|nr:uncharacterized protein LOC108744983 [Agrilus planipennis]XP_025837550.1 uncharacterized protein LOC112903901 [Agrilus planipennis]
MFKQLLAIVFLAFISSSYSQYISQGQCEDRKIKPITDFPGVNYYGTMWRWFTVFTSNIQIDCQYLNFERPSSASSNVISHQKYIPIKQWSKSNGVVTLASGSGQGTIDIKFEKSVDPVQFTILGYNHEQYTIDYYCENIDFERRKEILYARSRTRVFSNESAAKVAKILEDNGLGDIEKTYVVQDPGACLF